jgi:hypothetical protein
MSEEVSMSDPSARESLVEEIQRLALRLVDGEQAAMPALREAEDRLFEYDRLRQRAELTAAAVERRERERAARSKERAILARLKPLREAGETFVGAAKKVEDQKGEDELGMASAWDVVDHEAALIGVSTQVLELKMGPRLTRLAGGRDVLNPELARTPLDETARRMVAGVMLKATRALEVSR